MRTWTSLLAGVAVAALAVIAATAQMFSRGNGLVNDAAYALDREDWDRGVALAREALRSGELMPSNVPAAYNNYCIGLTGVGKYDEAMAACNKAIEMRPRQWSFYNNRANIYFYLGQFDRALAEYYKAMTFSPGDDVLLQNIALTLRVRKIRNQGTPGAQEKVS
jgi:tetratricopeptide (TPR) repeat protein